LLVKAARGRALEALYEWTIDEIHVAAYEPAARIEITDESGIWAQVMIPNSIGLEGQGLSSIVEDEKLRLETVADKCHADPRLQDKVLGENAECL
jgi:hypothetical protein